MKNVEPFMHTFQKQVGIGRAMNFIATVRNVVHLFLKPYKISFFYFSAGGRLESKPAS